MSKHARLSASSAHRWLKCQGSIKAIEGLPDQSSVYAATGTFAHHIAASRIGTTPVDSPDWRAYWLGNKTIIDGHTVECDQEMLDAIVVYLDELQKDWIRETDMGWPEMPLLEALQSIDPDLGGTADYVRYRFTTKHLRVFDFKYGSGMYVEADANEQMMLYALGAMLVVDKPITDVTVTIVQPRYEAALPVRDYHFKAIDILDFAADVCEAAVKTRLPVPPLAAGDWCKFCKAARTCPELEKRHHAIVAADFKDITVYNPDKLTELLTSIPLVKERIAAIEEFAYTEATKGKEIPGFKLVDKRPTRRWKSDGEVIEWAQSNAIDPYAERELLSPAQMEKKAGKKTPVPATLIESKSSGTALVPATDKRPPAKLITAADFDVIGG